MGSSGAFRQREQLEISQRWPSVARLMTEENIAVPSEPGQRDSWCFARNVYWDRAVGDIFIDKYEELLAFGFSTDGLNKDRITRLISRDETQSSGSWAELLAGHWLAKNGFKVEQWDPPARGSGKGDILVGKGMIKLFIEVKAFHGDQSYQDRGIASYKVARDVQTWLREYPTLAFGLVVEDASPRSEPYAQDVVKQLVMGAAQRVRATGNSEVVKIPMKESVVLVEVQIEGPRSDVSLGQVGMMGTQNSLKRLIKSVQKPWSCTPAIAVIYDVEGHLVSFDDRIGIDEVAEVCFGTSVEDTTGNELRRYRKGNGLWAPSKHSSLDAIFVIADRYFETRHRGVWGYLSSSDEAATVQKTMLNGVDRWVGPDDWKH